MKKDRAPSGPAHAVFSASGSHRWMNCAGSIALSKDVPEEVESIYAKEGTEAHGCHEFLLKNRKAYEKAKLAAKRRWPEEMVKHGEASTTEILNRLEKAGSHAELLCETRVDSSSFTCAEQFGTVDAAIVEEFGRLTVIDYKYGAGLVVNPEGHDGKGNSQLVYYALGISAQYHHNFSEVELVVIQPRAYHESGETTRSFVMSMDELLAWIPRFEGAVSACKLAESVYQEHGFDEFLNSGDWCRFCPAAVTCPELKTKAMKDAKIVFTDLGKVESVPEPRLIPALDLGQTLSACDRLEMWIDKVRTHAYQILERGGKIGGYKLVDKRAQRKWRNELQAEDEAWKTFGEAAFTEVKLLSPAALEKLSHHHFTKGEIADWVRRHTVKESSGRTMAKDSDRRFEVNPISSVFTVIDVEDENKQSKRRVKDGEQKRVN